VAKVKLTDLPNNIQQRLIKQGANVYDVFAVTGNRRLSAAKSAGTKINTRFATKKDLENINLENRFSTETAGRGIDIR